jgi:hypothetical protein
MPKRPPRGWMEHCISGVERSGTALDAGAVCGATWQRMDPDARVRATHTHEGNPGPMRRRRHHHTHKTAVLSTIGHAARSAHSELEHRGMPATAHAIAVLGGATMAIGSHVRNWTADVGGMMRPAFGEAPRLGAGHSTHRRRKRTTKRRSLTAAQRAAGFGGKRSMHHKKHRRKAAAHPKRRRRHLTAAQKAAGFGGKRAMHHKKRHHHKTRCRRRR